LLWVVYNRVVCPVVDCTMIGRNLLAEKSGRFFKSPSVSKVRNESKDLVPLFCI
jgi:hypothetical protein